MVKKKQKKSPKDDILDKIKKFEEHLKELRQQVDRGEVTIKNYFAINRSAFLIDTLIWEYLKSPKKK